MYWPSFNAALSVGGVRERTVINTVISLTASCVWVFILSTVLHEKLFRMEDLLNATLAGGVIIGATADICTSPWLAMLIGSIGGIIAILGYKYFTPWLYKMFDYHDTCGVTNLHGLSGLLGAIICCIVVTTSEEKDFDVDIGLIFPAMACEEGVTDCVKRTFCEQAAF